MEDKKNMVWMKLKVCQMACKIQIKSIRWVKYIDSTLSIGHVKK